MSMWTVERGGPCSAMDVLLMMMTFYLFICLDVIFFRINTDTPVFIK